MNGEDLFRGLSYVDEKFIDEAETVTLARQRKRYAHLVLIAALISLLGIVAFASTLPNSKIAWFSSFFGTDTNEEVVQELTANQRDVLYAGLAEINQSVTYNGYTITLESGLCDGYRALIKCRLEAPEGVSLSGRNYALDYESHIEFSGGEPGNYSASSYSGHTLEDEDPNDNVVTQLLEIIVQPSAGSTFSLADGAVWGFSFTGIEELTGYDEEAAWNTLCKGMWDFEVAFRDDLLVTESTELLSKPVRCLWSLHIRNRKIPARAKVFSFELRSLTATIRYKRPLIALFEGVYLDRPIYLILNDGSSVLVKVKMTTYREDYDETLCLFDRPISVEDVAYIEFPGVGKVEVSGTGNQ